ncbi:MAG: 16S rRNA (guanine(527)-N(7))-methyltransferase RsmG [Bacteroidales bacterium]|nr:16S rRNA (guanine(527)-N(7))-methyltransferase RsmG [Bacteroidales bacterium]MBQ7818352.1 16S rRNA (guanine(527)-N(7))-methyltransferase RsmG [Bacteroidales bacterium]
MDKIKKYFKNLSDTQIAQFEALDALYRDWNEKINVISRKDIDNLYEHHILHSLAIAKIIEFTPGSKILDVGTGGGFPGIPLAIMFPECQFLLVDRTGKKIKVAEDIANQIGLKNVSLRQCGVEEEKGLFDFVVSRAAMPMNELFRISRKNVAKHQQNALPNGIIALKGGDLTAEAAPFKNIQVTYELTEFFTEEFFETKKALFVPVTNRNK